MIRCRPHYLPREFSSEFIVAEYIPLQTDAGTKTTLNELYTPTGKQENVHPEVALPVAGDFNAGNLKSVLPNFHQHLNVQPEGKRTLDHLYPTRNTYKALLRSPLGKSDHNSILLIKQAKRQYRTKI
jgi:hypothetical protein